MLDIEKCRVLDEIHATPAEMIKTRSMGGFHAACFKRFTTHHQSIDHIARVTCGTRDGVRVALSRLGIEYKGSHRAVLKDEHDEIVRLFKEGKTVNFISKKFNRAQKTIKFQLYKSGLLGNPDESKPVRYNQHLRNCSCGTTIISHHDQCNWCRFGGSK